MSAPAILLDADIVCYQIAAAAEEPIDWGDGLWTLHAWEEPAIAKLEDYIETLRQDLGGGEVIACLSDSSNFRKDVLPTYKANRKATRKPLLLSLLRRYTAETYRSYQRPGLEGDDLLGILATSSVIKGEKVMVTIDKDLKCIPGKHLNMGKRDEGVYEVTEEQADYWHLFQTLTGDQTDGYAGCPGIGPKKAEAVLADASTPAEMWQRIVKVYEKAQLSEAEALVQARVARILRSADYDFKAKSVKLWLPPV